MCIAKQYIFRVAAAMAFLPLICSCGTQDSPDAPEPVRPTVPEGMVEIRPVLPGMYSAIPRVAPGEQPAGSRAYDTNATTEAKLEHNPLLRLPKGSTVWLIAESATPGQTTVKYEKKSYVVYNPEDDETMSYLMPCEVNANGEVLSMEGTPLYLKDGESYKFYAISPARQLDETLFNQGTFGFKVKNGEYFYANDSRYIYTAPEEIQVTGDNIESVQVIRLNPMINQTAELRFQIIKGDQYVHDLGIQPSGIEISGLQNDSPESSPNGLSWHMSKTGDEPITLQHGDKRGELNSYDYTIDSEERLNIRVPVLPMHGISTPIIVVFRLKLNGVPTSYEMMLNEKDLKAGYSYGYRGVVNISEGVDVITWQYVSWEYDVSFPFE